jgi:hypothetical protein
METIMTTRAIAQATAEEAIETALRTSKLLLIITQKLIETYKMDFGGAPKTKLSRSRKTNAHTGPS